MTHGRDHQEREQRVHVRRANQTAEEEGGLESDFFGEGHKRGTPPQGVIGAHTERSAPAEELEEPEPVSGGSEVAPTKRAEERERERHRAERKMGRMAAGIEENLRDRREPEVTREKLDEAARAADEKVSRSR
jgi:hypothetical protein